MNMRTITNRVRWLVLMAAFALTALASVLAMLDCGGASPPSAPTDDGGTMDDSTTADAATLDQVGPDASGSVVSCQLATSIPGCATTSTDGGRLSYGPRWDGLPGLEPCCALDR